MRASFATPCRREEWQRPVPAGCHRSGPVVSGARFLSGSRAGDRGRTGDVVLGKPADPRHHAHAAPPSPAASRFPEGSTRGTKGLDGERDTHTLTHTPAGVHARPLGMTTAVVASRFHVPDPCAQENTQSRGRLQSGRLQLPTRTLSGLGLALRSLRQTVPAHNRAGDAGTASPETKTPASPTDRAARKRRRMDLHTSTADREAPS